MPMVRALSRLTLSGAQSHPSLPCSLNCSFIHSTRNVHCICEHRETAGVGWEDSLVSGLRQAESGSKSLSRDAAHGSKLVKES